MCQQHAHTLHAHTRHKRTRTISRVGGLGSVSRFNASRVPQKRWFLTRTTSISQILVVSLLRVLAESLCVAICSIF
jgi:hypothetical protein